MDDRRMDSRREDDPRKQCFQHQENMVSLAEGRIKMSNLEEQTKLLFSKVEEQTKILRDIQLCVVKMDGKIQGLERKFDEFENRWDNRMVLNDAIIAEYREAMISINTRFVDTDRSVATRFTGLRTFTEQAIETASDKIGSFEVEYKKFDWFRNWMNGIQQELPRTVVKWTVLFVLAVAMTMAFVHQIDMAKMLKWIGIVK
jgi:hypothetical protein